MKFYTLKLKLWDDAIMDENSEGRKGYPQANGEKITNSNGYLSSTGNIGKIKFDNYVDDAPIFDYFYLYSTSYQKEYDWILLDAYSYIGQNTPSARGFLVSKKFKDILEQFNIAQPFRFYESMLMYRGEKLEYYIFHLAQDEWEKFNLSKSSFLVENKELDITISGNRDLHKLMKLYPDLKMIINLDEFSDLFYFSQFGYVVSDTLKIKIQNTGLLDFEFTAIENAQFTFNNLIEK